MTICRPYPIRGCAVWTQYLDDLNDMGMPPDHATMDHKPVTLAIDGVERRAGPALSIWLVNWFMSK